MGIWQAIVETIPAHTRSLAAMGLLGEIISIANQIARIAWVGAKDVVEGTLGKGGIGSIGIIDTGRIDISQKCRISCITQRTPLAYPAQATARNRDTIAARYPVIEPALHLLLNRTGPGLLSKQNSRCVGRIVPITRPTLIQPSNVGIV